MMCDIGNRIPSGHNVEITEKIDVEFQNIQNDNTMIMHRYELIGAARYSPGHWTAYIKHNTGWYFYDGSSRMHYESIPEGDLKMLYTLLYRQINETLFETIDPDDVSSNLKDYLDQYNK